MTEEQYWGIWDNISVVRFGSPLDESDISDEEEEEDIMNEDGELDKNYDPEELYTPGEED